MKRAPNNFEFFLAPPGETLAALTVWAPWSELIARGLKRFETRTWPPPDKLVGKDLIIHAAQRQPVPSDVTAAEREAIERALGIAADQWKTLPRGVLVAIVNVAAAYKVGNVAGGWLYSGQSRGPERRRIKLETEELFGDFRPGRWVWALTNLRPLSPIPRVGTQGLWPCPLSPKTPL